MHLNRKTTSILLSVLISFSMMGCQQQEKTEKTDEEQKIELPIIDYNELTNMEILEYEYTVQMELFDQVFSIMENCSSVGKEQSREQLIYIQEHKLEPTQKFIQNYDDILDKLILLAALYVDADDEGKKELMVYIEGLLHEVSQLNREFEKIMEGAQEL